LESSIPLKSGKELIKKLKTLAEFAALFGYSYRGSYKNRLEEQC